MIDDSDKYSFTLSNSQAGQNTVKYLTHMEIFKSSPIRASLNEWGSFTPYKPDHYIHLGLPVH